MDRLLAQMVRLTKALDAQTKAITLLAESNRDLADAVYVEDGTDPLPGGQPRSLSS